MIHVQRVRNMSTIAVLIGFQRGQESNGAKFIDLAELITRVREPAKEEDDDDDVDQEDIDDDDIGRYFDFSLSI